MIHGQPRPNLSNAIEVFSLTSIIRTLNELPEKPSTSVCLFTDGINVVLVDTSGHKYPRYKTPRIDCATYENLSDDCLEKLLKSKANGDEVDYIIGDRDILKAFAPAPT